MNLRRVAHSLGVLLTILGGAQLVPLPWCVADSAWGLAVGFLASAGLTATIGIALYWLGHKKGDLYRREGVLIVVGAWVLASMTGALPYLFTGAIASPIDALFEASSGFTTTGASILVNVDAVARPVLFWRCFTQWLGGIGIVVLLVALLSELGPGARFLFRLEVPGPKAEILHARVRETAAALARIYVALTLAQIALLLLLGLSFYDALTHTFSTVSTGGFSPHGDSVARFSTAVHIVVIFFMIAAGTNFALYHGAIRHRDLRSLRDVELRFYLGVLLAASVVLALDISLDMGSATTDTAVDAVFQVVSIATTTGFATANFDEWPDLSRATLVALMIFGGCAGSTAGGAKIARLIIGWKAALREVRLTFNPNAVIAVAMGSQAVPEESVRSVIGLILFWIFAWGAGTILLSIGDAGLVTAATGSIATLSNVGPGLAAVGPIQSFALFAPWQKLVMVLLMWLGRLEFFAFVSILLPRFWRR